MSTHCPASRPDLTSREGRDQPNLFQWEGVALMLAAIFAVVLVAEIAVTYIRRKII